MPVRETPLISGEIYHVFNRSLKDITLFENERYFRRMQMTMQYYLYGQQKLRLSNYLSKSREARDKLKDNLVNSQKLVEILTYTLMPNHFHMLLRQKTDDGIQKYLTLVQNSTSHYFNTKKLRYGPVFSGRFKAVLIESQEQLIHVSRYIHLNPVTAFIVKKVDELKDYPWSSWNEYLGNPGWFDLSSPREILQYFKDFRDYIEFVKSDVDFQRQFKSEIKLWIDMV